MSVMAPTTREYTIDDLLAMDADGPSHELVGGRLEELHSWNLASAVAARLGGSLGNHVENNVPGQVFDAQAYYQCFRWNSGTVRKPRLSFISADHLPEDWAARAYFTIAPDMVAEVLSPNDSAYKVNAKIKEYRRAGVRLIWVIDPEQRVVVVHRPDGSANTLQETDELTGEDVVPGFRCRVAELFPPRLELQTAAH